MQTEADRGGCAIAGHNSSQHLNPQKRLIRRRFFCDTTPKSRTRARLSITKQTRTPPARAFGGHFTPSPIENSPVRRQKPRPCAARLPPRRRRLAPITVAVEGRWFPVVKRRAYGLRH